MLEDQGPPKTREELVDRLADLRMQGILDPGEESRLLHHYDELQEEADREKARLEPEFERRMKEDGQDAAADWLRNAASELGQRHGEATRRLTDQLRVVTG
jgi:hypothetical protein